MRRSLARPLAGPRADLSGLPRTVPLVPAALGAVLVFLGLGRMTSPAFGVGAALAVTSGTVGLGLAVAAVTWRRHRLGAQALHLVLAGCVLLAAADTVADVQASGRTDRGAGLLLLAAACGLLLIERVWYLAGMGTVLLAWVALAGAQASTRGYCVAGLLVSAVLGHRVRRARLAALAETAHLRAELAHIQASTAALGREAVRGGAVIDRGTGLPDWRGLLLIGDQLLAIARRESEALGTTVVRIEGYWGVVEQFGTERAEHLAAHLAHALRDAVRATDAVGRWSPDELAVVAHGQGAGIDVLRTRLAASVAAGCPLDAQEWPRRLRLGRAVVEPWESTALPDVLVAARRALGEPIEFDDDAVAPAAARGPHEIVDAERSRPDRGARRPQRESR